jgi:hypothetical protein
LIEVDGLRWALELSDFLSRLCFCEEAPAPAQQSIGHGLLSEAARIVGEGESAVSSSTTTVIPSFTDAAFSPHIGSGGRCLLVVSPALQWPEVLPAQQAMAPELTADTLPSGRIIAMSDNPTSATTMRLAIDIARLRMRSKISNDLFKPNLGEEASLIFSLFRDNEMRLIPKDVLSLL